jgi:hypothetical protein
MPDVFLREDATVELGVGKNMVRAIRYWGLATRVIREYPDPAQPRRSRAEPTPFGRLLFGPSGWDPFLEDPRSVWLLHWMLLRPPSSATTWEMLIGMWSRGDFTEGEAIVWLKERLSREANPVDVADVSLRRDIQCLVQMYGITRRQRRGEDLVECPFRELALLTPSAADVMRWRFAYGNKPGLTDGILAFAVLDFISRDAERSTQTISRLALDVGGPGLVFRTSEAQLAQALAATSAIDPRLEVIAPAGVRQLVIHGAPSELAVEILAREYRSQAPRGTVDALVATEREEAAA